jgi:hypothetical protein
MTGEIKGGYIQVRSEQIHLTSTFWQDIKDRVLIISESNYCTGSASEQGYELLRSMNQRDTSGYVSIDPHSVEYVVQIMSIDPLTNHPRWDDEDDGDIYDDPLLAHQAYEEAKKRYACPVRLVNLIHQVVSERGQRNPLAELASRLEGMQLWNDPDIDTMQYAVDHDLVVATVESRAVALRGGYTYAEKLLTLTDPGNFYITPIGFKRQTQFDAEKLVFQEYGMPVPEAAFIEIAQMPVSPAGSDWSIIVTGVPVEYFKVMEGERVVGRGAVFKMPQQ